MSKEYSEERKGRDDRVKKELGGKREGRQNREAGRAWSRCTKQGRMENEAEDARVIGPQKRWSSMELRVVEKHGR